MKKSTIQTNVSGFAVIEIVDLQMDLNEEDQKQFDQEPEAVIQRLLEESGQTVNRMMLTKDFIERHSTAKDPETAPRLRPRSHHYHIVYPANERSGWICA